ncbi:MAG: TonB-dependent receptor [Betaproteobacteria bacterium]|nr:TonB-dependent receptor [Betaproteobacteria bacterium]
MKHCSLPPATRLGLLLLPMVSPLAHAASEPSSRLGTVVVTATRTEQPIEQTLTQTIVVSREDIERAGTLTLAELLQRFGGVEVRSNGGPGQPASVFMRGANSNHTLVLVDGLRVNSATAGAAALEHIPIENIERIEVVRGGLSGLYGSDALGGVIQVFTRKDAKPRLDASVGTGSPAATRMAVGLASTEKSTALVFDAGINDTRGASATNPRVPFDLYNPDRDPYRQSFASVRIAQTLWQGENVTLSAWQSRGEAAYDSGPGKAKNTQTLKGAQLVSENKLGVNWNSRLSVGRTEDDSFADEPFGGRFATRHEQVSWLNTFKTAYGHMNAGAEWRREKVQATVEYTTATRETASVFAGYLERLYGGQFEFSLRRDEVDGKERKNTGSFAYGYDLTPSLKAHIRGARAFRLPSYNDLYYPGFSNPDLKAEDADQREAGLRGTWNGGTGGEWRWGAVRFSNQIRGLIAFTFANNTFAPINIGRADIRGWEVDVTGNVLGVNVRGSYTNQKPIDRDTGKQLQSRARQFGSIDLSTTRGAWSYGMNVAGAGHRFDSRTEAAGSRMAGYVLLGANAGYQIDKRWRLEVTGNNLTNRRYELAQGYETPRRSVFVNARVKF